MDLPAPSDKPKAQSCRRLRGFKAFGRDEEGNYAVEFAMILAPFLALVIAILELGLVFFAGTHLEKAVDGASRLIRTGIAQNQNFTVDDFREALGQEIGGALLDPEKILIDVQTQANFSDIDTQLPITEGEVDDSGFVYNPGNGGEIVLVRVFYNWPVIAPKFGADQIGLDLSSQTEGIHILSSIKAFRNEPFD